MKFDFGKNWISYSASSLTPSRIEQARSHFKKLLHGHIDSNKSFLDIGFGQGLGLMIAAEAGFSAKGIDIDASNNIALQKTALYFPSIKVPPIETTSILDERFIERELAEGGFEIVYSWGVLHHTGSMFEAIRKSASLVKRGGILVLAIYNKHWTSPIWLLIKRIYNHSPHTIKTALIWLFYPVIALAKFLVTGRSPWMKQRGMDFYHDVVDWVGGYPYEYASPLEIKDFLEKLGFRQDLFIAAEVPTGCNEFVFVKNDN